MRHEISSAATAPRFEVADGYILLENFEFPKDNKSKDTTYRKHLKTGQAVKNTTYYTVRKHCALTPFGPFLSPSALEGLLAEMGTIVGKGGIVDEYNRLSGLLGLDLRCEVNVVPLRADVTNETFRLRLKRFTVEALSEMKADIMAGRLNQLTHRASPFSNLDLYCKGSHVSVLRTVYDSLKEQIAVIRREVAAGAAPTEAGAKASTRAIDEAIDYFGRST